ncbi:MAG: DNA-3-methyladenine glycosylase I [Pseudomonadales bacterium]
MVKTARCDWCGEDPLYVAYHDEEWGVPVGEPAALFERLMLEGMQAGLSWYTVLKKRARMREQFFGFDPHAIAERGADAVPLWLQDPGLIRHRGKLDALVSNARAFLALQPNFAPFVWSFVSGAPKQNRWPLLQQVPAHTPESAAMSRALRQAGFRFVGPTICYAFMQSVGMVNDHLLSCHRHQVCRDAGSAWSL